MEEIDVAIEASLASAAILRRHFRRNIGFKKKADGSPVTIADKESERKIVSIIRKHFPDHNILGEEFTYKKTDSEYKWIIDPLDMTKDFIRGIPFYSNLIALEKNGRVIAGVINIPEMNILARASSGKGAFVNGKRVRVSNKANLNEAFVVHGDINKRGTEPFTRGIFSLINGCYFNRGYGDALGYVLLAQGHVDIALDRPKPWDVAPAKIIIEEAGGTVTDFNGVDTIYSNHSVATNGRLHKAAIKVLTGE